MAGTCECGYEPSGSIKCGEFLDWLRTDQLLQSVSAAACSKYRKVLLEAELRTLRRIFQALLHFERRSSTREIHRCVRHKNFMNVMTIDIVDPYPELEESTRHC